MVVSRPRWGSRRCPVLRPKGCTGVLGTLVVHSKGMRHPGGDLEAVLPPKAA